MKTSGKILFICIIYSFFLDTAIASTKALVGCNIINPIGYESLDNAVIIIKDNKIIEIGKYGEVNIPKDAEIIDLKGKWVIPGLIDSHIHFFQSGGLYTRPDILDLRSIIPYKQELKQINNDLEDTFRRYLRCGITTVLDMGGPFWNFEVREKAKQTAVAPRVQVCGPLISTYHPAGLESDDMAIIKVNNVDEALKEVHKQLKANTDFIKIWYVVRSGHTPEEYYDIVKATADEAHKNGKRVIIHATELATAKAAVRAGADILAHVVYDVEVDDEFIKLCKDNNVIVSTTVVVSEGYAEALSGIFNFTKEEFDLANPYVMSSLLDSKKLSPDVFKPISEESYNRRFGRIAIAKLNIKKLLDAGVIIAANTDAGNIGTLPGPSLFREFELLSEAGLTPIQIITAATLNNAKLMGNENEIGTIEKGKLADFVILNSNPLADIHNTSDINLIVKDGDIFSPDKIIEKTTVDIIQQHLNAYNTCDINAFLASYHQDIKIYNYPDELTMSSIEDMRKRYQPLFENNPNQHAEIIKRIALGNYVIDHEKVTGRTDGIIRNAVAIYEVKNGLIYRVWFIREEKK